MLAQLECRHNPWGQSKHGGKQLKDLKVKKCFKVVYLC